MKKINITAFLLCSWLWFFSWSGQALAAEQCEVIVQLQQNGVIKTEAVNGLSGDVPFLLLRDFSDLTGKYIHWFSDSGAIGWTNGQQAVFTHPRGSYIYVVDCTPIYEEQEEEIVPEIKSFVPSDIVETPVPEGEEGAEAEEAEESVEVSEALEQPLPEEALGNLSEGEQPEADAESVPEPELELELEPEPLAIIGWEYKVKREKLPTPLVVEKDQTYIHSSLLVYLGYNGVWSEPDMQYTIVQETAEHNIISPPLEEAYRQIKSDLIKDLPAEKQVYGSYKTSFNPGERNRTINLKLAAAAINGQVIQPGKTFSFNKTVGPRTKERGYLEATIFVGGKKEQGLGGGICQVSSTLYNAVLASKLKIVERHTHSLPVTYVPTGKDATVSYGYLDFRFQNNKTYPVKIQAVVKKNTLEIAFVSVDK